MTSSPLTNDPVPADVLADLLARERIRHTIAKYNQHGDRFQLEALAECFTPDGVLHMRGNEPAVGRAAIVSMLSTVSDRPRTTTSDGRFFIRHFVASLLIESVTEQEARTTSYFAVLTPGGLDHWGRYRDELVPDGDRWLIRHRFVSVDAIAEDSWGAQ
jgi:hypothetical protein